MKGWWACSRPRPALARAVAGRPSPRPTAGIKRQAADSEQVGAAQREGSPSRSASVSTTCLDTTKMPPVGGKKAKKGILERLNAGEIVIGDGGFVFALEKRGYVKAGPWTPEAAVEHPEAVRQLHREFLRAGSNVMQTFTFYASEDKLENRGNYVLEKISGQKVNEAACDIARQVADEGDALVAGGVSQTPSYLSCKSETEVKKVFLQQLEVFMKKNVDFLIAEYFEHVEEAVWAVETLIASGKPVAATMCIGPEGDLHGVPPGECAVRLVKAGASIIGVNCHFDPTISLQTVKLMKDGLEAARLKAHLMSQPLAYHTPDCNKQGFIDLPEFPFGLEPRVATRWDIQKYAREAYNLGVRYIGGCCGFEPYHIRAIAEELAPERGFLPPASEKHGSWGSGLDMHTKPWVRARARKEYWENLRIASGRPYNPSMSKPDGWGVTKGTAELMQQKEATTEQQLKELFEKQKFKSQ
ncbi:betaine--homocysteine S-methyltransferase 1 [Chlorocebus sabaeus]